MNPYTSVSTEDLRALAATLRDTITASATCQTWAYYGRESQRELREVERELSRRTKAVPS